MGSWPCNRWAARRSTFPICRPSISTRRICRGGRGTGGGGREGSAPVPRPPSPATRPTLAWPYRPDRSVSGGLLRAGGRVYLKGLGVHSAAQLTYASDKPYWRFQAELAIDDETAGRGSVVFRVAVDDQVRYTSPIIRGGQAPTAISVDLSGARSSTSSSISPTGPTSLTTPTGSTRGSCGSGLAPLLGGLSPLAIDIRAPDPENDGMRFLRHGDIRLDAACT